MDFNLTAEQKLLQETVKKISQEVLAPRAAQVDREYLFPREGLRALSEAGMLGMLLPAPFGGGGANTLSFVLAAEEIARACANTALLFVTHVAASFGLLLGGSDTLKARYLPPLARGEKLAAFAATEANSGANPFFIETTAQSQGDGYLVTGSKVFITAGGEADAFLTLVKTSPAPGPQSLSLLLIEKGAPGFSLGKRDERMGLNGTSSRELLFEGCQVPKSHLLGKEGGYFPVLAMAMAGVGLLGAAAIALGIAQAALEASIRHGRGRLVGGSPLGNYQGIQFLVSEMAASVEAARALVHRAAFLRDNAPPGPPLEAMKAKFFATEMALKVTEKALQVHGGTGYSKELPLERYYRDARGLTLHFSPTEMLKETLGRFLLGLMP